MRTSVTDGRTDRDGSLIMPLRNVTFVGLLVFVCHISLPWVSFGSLPDTGPWSWRARISQLPSRRFLTFVWKKCNFGGERWLADSFPSSGSSLIVIGRIGLRLLLFVISLAMQWSKRYGFWAWNWNPSEFRNAALYTSGQSHFGILYTIYRGVFGPVQVWGVFS